MTDIYYEFIIQLSMKQISTIGAIKFPYVKQNLFFQSHVYVYEG